MKVVCIAGLNFFWRECLCGGVLRGFVRLFGKVEIWERNCFDGMREDLPSNCVGVCVGEQAWIFFAFCGMIVEES